MKDENKTKAQLIEESNERRPHIGDPRSVEGESRNIQHREIRREVRYRLRDAVTQMQSSDDIQHVLAVLKEGLHELKIPFQDCGINLIDPEHDSAVVSLNSLGKEGEWKEPEQAWGQGLVFQFWKEGVPVYRRDLEAEDLYGERQGYPYYFGHPVRCVLDIPFAYGTLAINSEKPDAFSPDDIAELEHLAAVLEEGFQRVEDLRNLEQQNRKLEAEITERKQAEEALKREYVLREAENNIRVTIASLDEPKDLYNVINEISVQLHQVGVVHDSCSIQIVNQEGTDFISFSAYIPEGWYKEIWPFITTGSRNATRSHADEYPWVIEVWRSGQPRYVGCTEIRGEGPTLTNLSLIDVPFTRGTLAINKKQSNAFSEDDVAVLQRFAKVLSDGFQRFLDITERKQAEEALKESEMRFRSLFQAMNEGVCLHEVVYDDSHVAIDYRILDVNRQYEKVLGLSKDSVLDKLASELYGSDAPLYLDTYAEVARTGKPVRFETYFPPMDKHFSISVFSPEEGRFATVFEDITDRKRMEEDLRRAHNLESLGVLAGGIAHDFNNVLTGVMGNLALLERLLDKDSMEYEIASEAQKAATKTKGLTHQLMTFAKGGAPVKEIASIEKLIREMTSLSLHGANTRAEFHFAEDLSSVDIDTGQIGQVIQNLVINADQAMPNGGILRISAENVEVSSDDRLPLESGRYVKVSVEDQGIGIPESILSQVFDPYFSTKESGHGLGLSICHSIVHRHGGHITVSSKVGIGTTFTFYLPASEKQIATTIEPEKAISAGSGRILLMDDEEIIHHTVGRSLKFFGYQVESAHDGNEAIQKYREALRTAKPFDVVIMDLTIPGGMGGKEAIGKLLEIDSKAQVIVSSGYSHDPVMANFAQYGFVGRIAKPVDIEELADTVKRILTARE